VSVAAALVLWVPVFLGEYRGQFYDSMEQPVGLRSYGGVKWTGLRQWLADDDLPRLIDWIQTHTEPDDVLAYWKSEPLTFFTQRPSTRLPDNLGAEYLRPFVVDYRVEYLIIASAQLGEAGYPEALRALQAAGAKVTGLGDYLILETRALWQR